ncbi:hypothetical protein AMTRI_Chr09g21020 [Amborella trichopoda]
MDRVTWTGPKKGKGLGHKKLPCPAPFFLGCPLFFFFYIYFWLRQGFSGPHGTRPGRTLWGRRPGQGHDQSGCCRIPKVGVKSFPPKFGAYFLGAKCGAYFMGATEDPK